MATIYWPSQRRAPGTLAGSGRVDYAREERDDLFEFFYPILSSDTLLFAPLASRPIAQTVGDVPIDGASFSVHQFAQRTAVHPN